MVLEMQDKRMRQKEGRILRERKIQEELWIEKNNQEIKHAREQ